MSLPLNVAFFADLLSVVMLNVVKLSVVAPFKSGRSTIDNLFAK